MRGWLLAVWVLLAPLPALAQGACPGRISSTVLGTVPSLAMLTVQVPGDDQANQSFQRSMIAALRRSGFTIGAPPTHVLTWRGDINARSRPDPLRTEQFSGRGSTPSRGLDDLGWMQGVPRLERGAGSAVSRIEGSVELRDVSSGRVIWSAQLTCARAGSNDAALVGTLVGVIVPTIGQTVRNREF